jgi:hypothetical protein
MYLVLSVYRYALGKNLSQVHYLNLSQTVQLLQGQHQSLLQVEKEEAGTMHFNKQQYDNFHDKQDKGQVQPEP